MKLLAITFSGLLLLTGCSTASTEPEQAVKLLEYEKCLEMQQELNNILNAELASKSFLSLTPLIKIFNGQGAVVTETGQIKRFEIHLKNCLPYRP